jgi:glutaredoxin
MSKKVIIFSTPTCPYCKRVKQLMTQRDIEFEEFDVSSDKPALERMKEISGGARSVPVIMVGDEVMVTPEENQLEKALERLEN